jgi:hypothetical protein
MERNMKNGMLTSFAFLISIAFSGMTLAVPIPIEVSYKKDVSPIIHDYCLNCHEPGGKGYEKSGLNMQTYQSLIKGTRFGAVIKPGDSFTSIFIQVIEGRVHDAIKMPYGMNGGLSKQNISVLKRWVDQGAKDN